MKKFIAIIFILSSLGKANAGSNDEPHLLEYTCSDAFVVTISIDKNNKAFATGFNTDVDDLEFENVEGTTSIEDGYLCFTPNNKKDLDSKGRYDKITSHFRDYCNVKKIK